MSDSFISKDTLEGQLSSFEVEQLLQRSNKMIRQLLNEDEAVSGKAIKVNPYGGKLKQLRGRVFLMEPFVEDKEALKQLCLSRNEKYLELCSGSGRHLIHQALKQTGALHLGVELRLKRTVRTVEKAESLGAENLYMVRANAELIGNIFEAETFDGVWVNFPDPWEKERDHKHRVLSKKLLDRLSWLLKKGGFLAIRTDHSGYFNDFLKEVEQDKRFVVVGVSRDFHNSEFAANSIKTEFESLFLSQGLPINYLHLERR